MSANDLKGRLSGLSGIGTQVGLDFFIWFNRDDTCIQDRLKLSDIVTIRSGYDEQQRDSMPAYQQMSLVPFFPRLVGLLPTASLPRGDFIVAPSMLCHSQDRERRTAIDWAHEVRDLLETHYADAKRIHLVCENLNTHSIGSLYEAFPPEQARDLASRLEIHHTPKHGSWLNIVEIEISALSMQCLDRRIPDIDALKHETKSWEQDRNTRQKGVNW